MTILNMVRKDGALHLFTDAAWTDAGGILTSIESKVHVLEQQRAVIAVVGPGRVARLLGQEIEAMSPTFDAIVEDFGAVWPEIHARRASEFAECRGAILAGWSQNRAKAEAYMLSVTPVEFGPIDLEWFATPNFGPAIEYHFTHEMFVPTLVGLAIMDAQRKERTAPFDDFDMAHRGGGFAEITTIEAGKVTKFLRHTWQDCVGEPIDPKDELDYEALGSMQGLVYAAGRKAPYGFRPADALKLGALPDSTIAPKTTGRG